MKVAAVIAEYNPFHTGHLYQLTQVREKYNADYIIIMMSGDFVQRGAPAIMDKYTRSRMALSCGADLILELPVSYALGSAEYFAHGAVFLLHQLGVVNLLHFGSECGNINILDALADLYLKQPADYTAYLSSFLKDGLSFPVAREKASLQYFRQHNLSIVKNTDWQTILSSPNNVLGIEYCKAIRKQHSSIIPVTLLREGSGYHDSRIDAAAFPSATAIRKLLIDQPLSEQLAKVMPKASYDIYTDRKPPLLTENDFSAMLHYKLLSQKDRDYTRYLDVTPDLSDRIANSLQQYTTLQNFCMLLKSKNYTYTRICRCMFHILLDIYQSDSTLDNEQMPHYVRVLGFRKDATPLLSEIKKKSSITLLSKLANYDKILSPADQEKVKPDLYAYNIYHSAATAKSGTSFLSEFAIPSFPYSG